MEGGAPGPGEITAACRRVALATCFPTFAGGVYAFDGPDLRTGRWLPLDASAEERVLAFAALPVPRPRREAFALTEARLRVALEDLLAARFAAPRPPALESPDA